MPMNKPTDALLIHHSNNRLRAMHLVFIASSLVAILAYVFYWHQTPLVLHKKIIYAVLCGSCFFAIFSVLVLKVMRVKGMFEFYITPKRILVYDDNQLQLDRRIADIDYILDKVYSASDTMNYEYIVFVDDERYELTKTWNTGLSTQKILKTLQRIRPELSRRTQKCY